MKLRVGHHLWRSEDYEPWQERPTGTVHEDDPTPVRSGLLGPDGTPLYRVPERVQMGFPR